MSQPQKPKRYRCRFCGTTLPAWLPVPQVPDGAMLLGHLSQRHPTEVWTFLEKMRTQDIAQVAAQAFDLIEADEIQSDRAR
jgi:hypothetical protein